MADPRGFLNIEQQKAMPRPVHQRIKDFHELYQPMPVESVRAQASRCMDCGVPFCHTRLPAGELDSRMERAGSQKSLARSPRRRLHDTNNFPEFTGQDLPRALRVVLCAGDERRRGDDQGHRGGHRRSRLGDGLDRRQADRSRDRQIRGNRRQRARRNGRRPAAPPAGHTVTVYERDDRAGGLLAYGIPDFKMAKVYVERRIDQLEAEGVRFVLNTEIGRTIDAHRAPRPGTTPFS